MQETKPGHGRYRRIMSALFGRVAPLAEHLSAEAALGREVPRGKMLYVADQLRKRRHSRASQARRQGSKPNPLKRKIRHNGFKRNFSGHK